MAIYHSQFLNLDNENPKDNKIAGKANFRYRN